MPILRIDYIVSSEGKNGRIPLLPSVEVQQLKFIYQKCEVQICQSADFLKMKCMFAKVQVCKYTGVQNILFLKSARQSPHSHLTVQFLTVHSGQTVNDQTLLDWENFAIKIISWSSAKI